MKLQRGQTIVSWSNFFFQYLPTQFYEEDKELKQNQNEIVYYSQIPFDVQDRPKI